MSDHLFSAAVTLIQAGELEIGQRMLMRVVRENPHHAEAWFWLSKTTPKYINQIGCLERVLQIDPHHETAKKLMSELQEAQAKAVADAIVKEPEPNLEFEYLMGRKEDGQENGMPHLETAVATSVINGRYEDEANPIIQLKKPIIPTLEAEQTSLNEGPYGDEPRKAIHIKPFVITFLILVGIGAYLVTSISAGGSLMRQLVDSSWSSFRSAALAFAQDDSAQLRAVLSIVIGGGSLWGVRHFAVRHKKWWSTHCPGCEQNNTLERTHRTYQDRLWSLLFIPIRRYRCRNCRWKGIRLNENLI